MSETIIESAYRVQKPDAWAPSLTDAQIIEKCQETSFSRAQNDEGRDYCFFIDKIYHTTDYCNSEYAFLAYTLNEPSNLEKASINEIIVEDNEVYQIHRISVLREGVLIDKIPDLQIKVLDGENQSATGVLNNFKKINITVKDLRLYDILILEDTKVKTFTPDEFLRRDFAKYVWVGPDVYWAYGHYKFQFINERQKTVACKKLYFRDSFGTIITPEVLYLEKGEKFVFEETEYINPVDSTREIHPFIDFATKSDWHSLSNYMVPIYQAIYDHQKLEDFAPNLIEKIDAFTDLEDKLRFAIEYVQNNINYIYNAYEMNGHKPQEPAKTFENKQGDCKAKSVLMKVVLDYIGVEAAVVLVNYNTDVYLAHYFPSLLSFNHAIVKIKHKNEIYFVDATQRDEFGYLENRGFIFFKYYLEIGANQELQKRPSFEYNYFAIDEKVNFTVKNNIGDFSLTTIYKGNRANNMRKYFKSTNKREIIDSWNNFLYHTLHYSSDRKGTDVRTIFPNASIDIVSDDKNANEFTICYKTTIDKAYYVDGKNNRFLMYFDRTLIKDNAREYTHKDLLYWQTFENERYEIALFTDLTIDQKERYTVQEANINNRYFTHKTTKQIQKNGAIVTIESRPISNIEIESQDFEAYRIAHHNVADSNFGLGIDIVQPSVFNFIKSKIMG